MCFLGNKGQKNKNKTATNDLICFETSDLTIPPSMGYGNRAMGAIPANSVLIFEVDLLVVE